VRAHPRVGPHAQDITARPNLAFRLPKGGRLHEAVELLQFRHFRGKWRRSLAIATIKGHRYDRFPCRTSDTFLSRNVPNGRQCASVEWHAVEGRGSPRASWI